MANKRTTRRKFLAGSSAGLAALAAGQGMVNAALAEDPQTGSTPGTTPAFGTAAPAGPEVSAATFAEAEKLVQVAMSPAERAEAAGNWRQSMASIYKRRTGPNKVPLEADLTPGTVWNPQFAISGEFNAGSEQGASTFQRSNGPMLPLPASDDAIAFCTVARLSRWIENKQLTSERLTKIYLTRLEKYNKQLNCVITLTRDHALEQARRADAEIARGHYRGPLHGIPWGAKDLLDTKGIPTTYGAEPFRDRVPVKDAAVVRMLEQAGAVLVAKLSLGALALNDVWFGGQTKNPWSLEEGASGSSAGPAAAVAAGLVGFAIGSETQGSIISPSMRCGVTGLRPTYGRVPRTGAMTLSWTCDKLGPMARSVEDTALVLKEIAGTDPGDTAGVAAPLPFNAAASVYGLRVGYVSSWMNSDPATDVDRAALATLKKLGAETVPVSLPEWPYDSLNAILFVESAAAFEEITLDNRVDELKMQVPDAWPNTFRQSRFISAVDFVQADRMRHKVAMEVARVMAGVDMLLVPSLGNDPLIIFNFTGHPSLTLRAGFVEVKEARSDWAPDPKHPVAKFATPRRVPYGVTLIGKLFEEGRICEVGMALEASFAVAAERPAGF